MTDGRRNLLACQQTDVKVAGTASSEDECLSAAIPHLVEQPKTFYLVRGLLSFADTAFEDGHLVNLPIVLARLLLEEVLTQPLCPEVAGNAERVRMMGFFQSVADAGVLRQISVGIPYIKLRALCLQAVEKCPSHDSHKSSVSECLSALCLQNDLSGVIRLMARLTERNQVIRGVPTRFTAFEVVDVKNRILGLAVAMAALVVITEEDVFADVPKAELIALLVLRAFNAGFLYLLDVETGCFDDDFRHRKKFPDSSDAGQVGVDFVLNARSQPTLIFAVNAVVETRCAITCLAIATRPTHLSTRRQ